MDDRCALFWSGIVPDGIISQQKWKKSGFGKSLEKFKGLRRCFWKPFVFCDRNKEKKHLPDGQFCAIISYCKT